MTTKPDVIRCFYCDNRFTAEHQAIAVNKKGKVDEKQFEYIRCPRCLSARNSMYYASKKNLDAGTMIPISPLAETPFNASEGVSAGGNVSPIARRASHLSWYCLEMKKRTGRDWPVDVSAGALIEPGHGWICDCGSWTFGDDASHQPRGLQMTQPRKKRGDR